MAVVGVVREISDSRPFGECSWRGSTSADRRGMACWGTVLLLLDSAREIEEDPCCSFRRVSSSKPMETEVGDDPRIEFGDLPG